jgi:hypothetical protein
MANDVTPGLIQGGSALAESSWIARQQAHETRVRAWTDPHQERAGRGEKHPVFDFLFGYYSFRPSWLRRWHPGAGVSLKGTRAEEFLQWPDYHSHGEGVAVDHAAIVERRGDTLRWIKALLVASRDRPAFFACYGLHEWAMVYRETPDAVRHSDWPLRFPADELARVVESQVLRCSHHDAFRFFTPAARPMNRLQPDRVSIPQYEQRGCLHANMDLYKWSFKLAPLTPSELVADCFELARSIREIDMRASPYDLSALGFAPIRIETEAGRAEYEGHQRLFAQQGEPLTRTSSPAFSVLFGFAKEQLQRTSNERAASGKIGRPSRFELMLSS